MSKLVFDATDKYVHPTRYRQIVETASSRQLSSSAQSTISGDQKHSSVVARVHYQKKRSREVASKANEYLERLHGEKGLELEIDVRSRLSGNSASSGDQNGSKTDTSSNDEGETIAETPPERLSGVPRLKRENAFITTDFPARKESLMFTPEEDNYLKAGIERHGYGQWKAILRGSDEKYPRTLILSPDPELSTPTESRHTTCLLGVKSPKCQVDAMIIIIIIIVVINIIITTTTTPTIIIIKKVI